MESRVPGFNFFPIGRLPTTAETSSDGCLVAVSNEGSCDLAVADVLKVEQSAVAQTELPGAVMPIVPHTAAGPLRARPHTLALPIRDPVASSQRCSGHHTAFVVFPGCDLVAEIDLTDGSYVRGVFIGPDGTPVDAGPAPTCAVECTDTEPVTNPPAPPGAARIQPDALAFRKASMANPD